MVGKMDNWQNRMCNKTVSPKGGYNGPGIWDERNAVRKKGIAVGTKIHPAQKRAIKKQNKI
jgi:hypothetical protein